MFSNLYTLFQCTPICGISYKHISSVLSHDFFCETHIYLQTENHISQTHDYVVFCVCFDPKNKIPKFCSESSETACINALLVLMNNSPMFQEIGHRLDGDHHLRLRVVEAPLSLVDPHSPPAVAPHPNLQGSDRRRTTTTRMTTKMTTTMTMPRTIRINNFIPN